MSKVNAIRVAYNGITKAIQTPVEIISPVNNKSVKTKGLWDTGATASVITKEVAQELGIEPLGFKNVRGVHGVKQVNSYAVKIRLNNENIMVEADVTESESLSDNGETGLLIGMDIITLGDFAISNYEGKTNMTFRVPSVQKIDFVDGIRQGNQIITGKLPSRNSPCPCGSGKKYKHCCGNK